MSESPPELVLVDFEVGFLHLWLAVNQATSQLEKGTDPQRVTPILRQELNQALNTIVGWRSARDRPTA